MNPMKNMIGSTEDINRGGSVSSGLSIVRPAIVTTGYLFTLNLNH
jgi:hypothetical protein